MPLLMSYMKRLVEEYGTDFTEEDLWQAIADELGVGASEIMDGDLVEYL